MHSRCLFILAPLLLCLSPGQAEKRSLSYQINPDCTPADLCRKSTLVHIESTSPNSNTYHYLWSFVHGYTPAIFAFETDHEAKLQVDWQNFSTNNTAMRFNGSVFKSFAYAINDLYFVNLTESNVTVLEIPLKQLEYNATDLETSSSEVRFKFDSVAGSGLNGSLSIVLSAHAEDGRSDSIPRLQFTESSNVLEMTLTKVYLKESPENKYIKAQLVSNLSFAFEGQDVVENLQENVSIDDEYTPGVFQRFIYSLLSTKPANKHSAANASAYVEWKPVAYFDDTKVIAKSIKVTPPVAEKGITPSSDSILKAYFTGPQVRFSGLNNFKFGDNDDDFDYQSNRYLQFSMAFGLNKVPEETLSMTLKIIIASGLGLPMLLFIISIIYTITRKLRSTNDFATLNEDTTS